MYTRRRFAYSLSLTIALLILLACAPQAEPTPVARQPSPAPTRTLAGAPPTLVPASPAPTTPAAPSPTLVPASPMPTTPTAQASPVPTRTPASLRPYDDPDGFWRIGYPAGWTMRRPRSETQFRPTEDSRAFLGVSPHVKARDLDAFVLGIVDLLQTRAVDWQIVDQGPRDGDWGLGIGDSGWQIDYRRTVDGEELQGTLVCLVRYRIGYVLLAEGPPTDFDTHQATFEAMMDSLRLTDFPGVIPYEQWQVRLTELDYLSFHYPPDSAPARDINRIDQLYNDAYADNAVYLGIRLDRPIDVYLYPTRAMRYQMTARNDGFAMIPEYEVHSLWAEDEQQTPGHEVVHVLTGIAWGEPGEALLGEGLAVWLDHSGNDPHDKARVMLAAGALPALRDLLGDGWFQQDASVTYPVAGSLVGVMLEKFGVAKFKQIYLAQDFEAELQSAVGWTLPELEAAWHDHLLK